MYTKFNYPSEQFWCANGMLVDIRYVLLNICIYNFKCVLVPEIRYIPHFQYNSLYLLESLFRVVSCLGLFPSFLIFQKI